jgi:aryl-alcohol dehydrogenase-like predicted oxidoreductase
MRPRQPHVRVAAGAGQPSGNRVRGASSVEQLDEILGSLEVELDDTTMSRLNEAERAEAEDRS